MSERRNSSVWEPFAYCEEDDTYAAKNFSDSIPQEVKESRLEKIMAIQEDVALESNQSKIGKTMTVVIDREEPDYFVGRTEFDSPEVDPEVLIDKDDRLTVGNFYDVEITDALPFEPNGKTERLLMETLRKAINKAYKKQYHILRLSSPRR